MAHQQAPRSQQLPILQQPTPGTHQLPGIPPTAASLQQGPAAMAAARQQQTMMQGKPNHAPGMARPSGPTLAGPPSHPMPQGAIKHEGLQPGLAQGQAPMRAPSPPVRAMSPAAPAGFTQAQLLQQQQAALQHAHQLPGMLRKTCWKFWLQFHGSIFVALLTISWHVCRQASWLFLQHADLCRPGCASAHKTHTRQHCTAADQIQALIGTHTQIHTQKHKRKQQLKYIGRQCSWLSLCR